MFLLAVLVSSCINKPAENKINLRLKWAYQAQFAGYLVAKEKGFYKDAGVDINIQPAGPDLKPYSTVAAGSDDIGVGIISQVLTARSNGVPLVSIAQIFQDSPNRFVLKSENKIGSLKELKGKKVGLWMGGDEVEFISMLKTVGLTLRDIDVIPQKFSVAPFLENSYVCSQVMLYNELIQIENNGYASGKLQIFSPKDYHSAILGDLLFTNEKFLANNRTLIEKFLAASFKGWDYAKANPQEAIEIVLKYNPELKADEQQQQLKGVLSLIYGKNTTNHGLGFIDQSEYENAKTILLGGMQASSTEAAALKKLDVKSAFDKSIVENVHKN